MIKSVGSRQRVIAICSLFLALATAACDVTGTAPPRSAEVGGMGCKCGTSGP